MADDESVPGTPEAAVPAEPASEPPAAEPAPAPAPALKTRWRDRAWSFRAMLAVALASLVIGGVAGGVIGAVASGDHDHGDGHYRIGPGGPGMKMPPGWQRRGPRDFGGGPGWQWNGGPQQGPTMTPYGGSTPSTPATPSTPTPTG